jgi:hypothetical protein
MLHQLRRLISPATPPAPEARRVELGGQTISYTLKRSARRRSIGLRIDHRGLTVSIPLRATETWLHDVLRDKADWVVDKLGSWQSRHPPAQRWAGGETLPFRGGALVLRIESGRRAAANREESVLRVALPAPDDTTAIERTVMAWYRRQATQLFSERVAFYAERLGVLPRAVKLSSARTRWGSCTTHGVVRLNWRLVKLPPELADYVVVHELAHLREMNHSAAFWRVVEHACPDYADRRRALRLYALGGG